MAIFLPGAAVGAISGSVGAQTFSHNKGGPYIRLRTIPTNPNTGYQQSARAYLANASQAFAALTTEQKIGWGLWAQLNPITNALGQSKPLSGHGAFVQSYCRCIGNGVGTLTDPPVGVAPDPLIALSIVVDEATNAADITFATTPTGANDKVVVRWAVTESAGIMYIDNLLKTIYASGPAQASPIAVGAKVEERFGEILTGQIHYCLASVINDQTGLISRSIRAQCVAT